MNNRIFLVPLPFGDIKQSILRGRQKFIKFVPTTFKQNIFSIMFKSNTKHKPYDFKEMILKFLCDNCVFMSNPLINTTTQKLVGYYCGFKDGFQWRLKYKEVLNKVIDKVVKARLPSVAQKGYENLYKEVKMVIFQSKTGIHE